MGDANYAYKSLSVCALWSVLVIPLLAAPPLKRELERKSKESGLSLARLGGTSFWEVMSFSGRHVEKDLAEHPLVGSFSADGRSYVIETGKAIVVFSNERELWRSTSSVTANDVSLSPDRERVAVKGVDHCTQIGGYYVVSRGASGAVLLHSFGRIPRPPEPSAGRSAAEAALYAAAAPSWSGDGSSVAFPADGKIVVFDFRTGMRRAIAVGRGAWFSPDGQRLAICLPDGTLNVGGVDGDGMRSLRVRLADYSSVRWSPDAQYLLLTVRRGDTRCGYLTVYRISDGATYSVSSDCIKGDGGVGWYVDESRSSK